MEIIVIKNKRGCKVDRIESSVCTNGILSLLKHFGQNGQIKKKLWENFAKQAGWDKRAGRNSFSNFLNVQA